MTCHHVTSLICAYIDGELSGVEMLAVKHHLATCQVCGEEFESLRHVKRMLSRLGMAAPREALAADICTRLDECRIPAYQRAWNTIAAHRHLHLRPALAALAAVGAALILATAGSIGEHPVNVAIMQQAPDMTVRPLSGLEFAHIKTPDNPSGPAIPTDQSSWFIPASYPIR